MGVFLIEFNSFGGESSCGSSLYNWVRDRAILYDLPGAADVKSHPPLDFRFLARE